MGGSGNHPANLMIIGRWSEFRVVIGLQRETTVRCVEAIERSGEELGPVRGILVGSSSLRRACSLLLRRFALWKPLLLSLFERHLGTLCYRPPFNVTSQYK